MWIIKLNRIFSFSSLFYCVYVFVSQTTMAMIWIFRWSAHIIIVAICVQFIWVDVLDLGWARFHVISITIQAAYSQIIQFGYGSKWNLLIMKSNEWNIILCEKKGNESAGWWGRWEWWRKSIKIWYGNYYMVLLWYRLYLYSCVIFITYFAWVMLSWWYRGKNEIWVESITITIRTAAMKCSCSWQWRFCHAEHIS